MTASQMWKKRDFLQNYTYIELPWSYYYTMLPSKAANPMSNVLADTMNLSFWHLKQRFVRHASLKSSVRISRRALLILGFRD